MKSHLILIGAPGSGKGTQASKLVSDRGFNTSQLATYLDLKLQNNQP
jgi:adenylate kinase family enzyme